MSDTRNIDLTFVLPADRDAVWASLTNGDALSRWFAPEVRVNNPGAEGTFFISWGPGMECEVKVRTWQPGEHLGFDFGENSQTKATLMVDYHLETKGGSTVLRLVHSGFSADAEWDEEFESHLRGWRIFLHNLRHDLVHQAKAFKQHMICADTALDRGDAWMRVLGKNGLDREGALVAKKTGDKVELVTSNGERLSGTVQVHGKGRDLAMTLDGLGASLLRISFERRSKGGTMIYGVLSAYGDDQGRAEAVAGKLRDALQAALAT
jgi:uncharacterized protein YndB with AHSA1/START domain